jgi:hypothetical protein
MCTAACFYLCDIRNPSYNDVTTPVCYVAVFATSLFPLCPLCQQQLFLTPIIKMVNPINVIRLLQQRYCWILVVVVMGDNLMNTGYRGTRHD